MDMSYSMPAMRGMQGKRMMYSIMIPFRTLVRLLRLDDAGSTLERSQRDVNNTRAKAIANYMLANQESYVLPGLTGVIEIPEYAEPVKFTASELNANLGVLEISMDAIIRLFDGQHRGCGIAKALELADQNFIGTIPLTLYSDMTIAERQQAFTDINQNASKPPQGLSDTYNHRDELSQLVHQVLDDEQLKVLKNCIDYAHNKPSASSRCLWSFKQLKDATAIYLGKKQDFADGDAAAVATWLATLINELDVSQLIRTPIEPSLLTTTVMLKALATASSWLNSHQEEFEYINAYAALSTLDWSVDSNDFKGCCICPNTGKMLANADALKRSADYIIMNFQTPRATDEGEQAA